MLNEKTMSRIQNFRQPMVTATGIFLGFMLEFTSRWINTAFTDNKGQVIRDIIIGMGVLSCIALLQIVLYRILRMNYPEDKAGEFYQRTLQLFMIAITIPFVAFVLIILYRMLR